MKKTVISPNSKAAERIMQMMAHKKAIQAYIKGTITLAELNEKGIKFAQPVRRNIRVR